MSLMDGKAWEDAFGWCTPKPIPVQVPKEVPTISLDPDHTHIIILNQGETTIECANELTNALSSRGLRVLVLLVPGNPAEVIAALELKDRTSPLPDTNAFGK